MSGDKYQAAWNGKDRVVIYRGTVASYFVLKYFYSTIRNVTAVIFSTTISTGSYSGPYLYNI